MPETSTKTATSGRDWAYAGIIAGGLVSVAANVAHSFIPPTGAPAGWTPELGAVVGAIVWPVFLFIAVEILVRVAWPAGWAWRLLRFAGLLPVALVAGLVSYRHLSGLLAHYGEEPIVYLLGPLAVDGLMVMATGALWATGRHRTRQATLSVSVPAARPTVVPSTMAAPTPIAPSVMDSQPSTTDTQPTTPATPVPVTDPVPVPVAVPSPAELAARITKPRTSTPARPAAGPTRTARSNPSPTGAPAGTAPSLAPSTTDTSVTASEAAQLALPLHDPDLLDRAREAARQYQAEHGTPVTPGQLAVRLKVPTGQAQQLLADLDQPTGNPNPTTVNGNHPRSGAKR
jgi:hypothetical protein